jgi:hypothetical protein
MQVYSKTYEVRNEYRQKVTTNKGKTTTRTETVKVESLVSERMQGHKWLSVRDDTASVGVVQVSALTFYLSMRLFRGYPFSLFSDRIFEQPDARRCQISVGGDQKELSRLRRKVVNDFEPIAAQTNPSLQGAADGTLMSLAKSALVAAIQSQARSPHILGYRYIQEVIEPDKPLFLLGGSFHRSI